MPLRDRTGPLGKGPITGRGWGPCGMGLGWRGRTSQGRGLYYYFDRFNKYGTEENQKKALEEYRKALEEELEDVKMKEKDLH